MSVDKQRKISRPSHISPQLVSLSMYQNGHFHSHMVFSDKDPMSTID